MRKPHRNLPAILEANHDTQHRDSGAGQPAKVQTMQSIHIASQSSRFVRTPHLVVTIDGQPLDERLAKSTTKDWLRGLVSTWTGWLEVPEQQEIVNVRSLMLDNGPTILPILVCPNDRDFSCTVGVVEVLGAPDQITWSRFGIDKTPTRHAQPKTVGSIVDWLSIIRPMSFGRDAYTAALAAALNVGLP